MRWRMWAVVGLTVGGLCVSPHPTRAIETPTVYFRELMWAGTDRSTADEWFVLTNSTNVPMTLDGWRVTTVSGTSESLVANLDGLMIGAQGSLLIASHDQHHQFSGGESALAIDPDLIVSALTLSNTALQLRLYQPGSTVPVDTAGSGKAPLAGTTKPPTAMERLPATLDGTLKTSWTAATSARHLDPGSTALASPDHSGRPTISTTSLPAVPVGIVSPISVAVSDPDGEDDIALVRLSCPEATVTLVDTGLAGDATAGDRRFTGRLMPMTTGSTSCLATVTDRSGLSQSLILSRFTYVRSANVIINELLPSPVPGTEEFIELNNREPVPVDLSGWQLDDQINGGSKPFTLTQTIPADGFLVITASQSKLALNNDGDEVNLINPEGLIIDQTQYGSATVDQAWARFSAGWGWTNELTPGLPNPLNPPVVAPSLLPMPTTTVRQFANLPAQTSAQLTGHVVALPGTLSRRSWLLDDGTGTAEIYLDHGDFSPLNLGDWVTVVGRRSTVTAPRLLVDTGAVALPTAIPVPIAAPLIDDILATNEPNSTYVSGQVTLTKVNTKTAVASCGARSITLIWSNLLPTLTFSSGLKPGQSITLTGILTHADSISPSLTLRTSDDLLPGPLSPATPSSPSVPAASGGTALVQSHAVSTVSSVDRLVLVQSIPPMIEAQTAVAAALLITARLEAQARWLDLARQATATNVALRSLLVSRSVRRLIRWQRLDQSAIVTLLTLLGMIQLFGQWRQFLHHPSIQPWLGG